MARLALVLGCMFCGHCPPLRANLPNRVREAVQRDDTVEVTRLLAGAAKDESATTAASALIWSAYYGRIDLLNVLLKNGVPAAAADQRGWNALLAAVKGNQPGAVDILLAHGADASAWTHDGKSCAAMLASELGRDEIVRRFRIVDDPAAQAAAEAQAVQKSFLAAALDGRFDKIKQLLSNPGLVLTAAAGAPALQLAIAQQDTATVSALLDHGADANEPMDDDRDRPLLTAAATGNVALVRLLVERGAAINGRNLEGSTALRVAIFQRAGAVAADLLARGARLAPGQENDLLPLAIDNHLPALVAPLAAAGANVDYQDNRGRTPLMHAVAACPDAIDPLLALHARVDLRDQEGRNVFDLAGSEPVTAKLRLAQAGTAATGAPPAPHLDRTQLTEALLAAVKKGDAPTVKTLLDQGASPNARNKLGWPVGVLAGYGGSTEILRLLYERDRHSLDQDSPEHWTALMEAAGHGHLEAVRFLLDHDPEPDQITNSGNTPLQLAENRHHPEVAEVLRQAEANSPLPGSPSHPPMP